MRIEKGIVSVFYSLINFEVVKNIHIKEWFDLVKDETFAEKYKFLLSFPPAIRKEHTQLLPTITPIGAYTGDRYKTNLISYSGYRQFDIDNLVTDCEVIRVKEIVCASPFTYCCGISSSGLGLWGLFEIPPNNDIGYFLAMREYLKLITGHTIDNTNRIDICRSYWHDKELYVNENNVPFYPDLF